MNKKLKQLITLLGISLIITIILILPITAKAVETCYLTCVSWPCDNPVMGCIGQVDGSWCLNCADATTKTYCVYAFSTCNTKPYVDCGEAYLSVCVQEDPGVLFCIGGYPTGEHCQGSGC